MGKLIPYDYQADGLGKLDIVRAKGKRRALAVMATGLGKTALAAFDVEQFSQGRKIKVLYICHQTSILEQAQPTFSAVLGTGWSYGFLHGARKDFEVDVLYATFQTMRNYLNHFHPEYFDYIVVDESHHVHAETYLPTILYFNPKFLLGITATPEREDLLDIREIFGKEAVSITLERALARGYLTRVEYLVLTDDIDESVFNELPGKLTVKEIGRRVFIPKRDDEIANIVLVRMGKLENPKVAIFCSSINHCEAIAALLPGSRMYHSSMHIDEQKESLEWFKATKKGILITIDMLNEGVDVPDINILVFLRSTDSLRVFLQQLGRGLRKIEGKDFVLALDFVGNVGRLQMLKELEKRIRNERERFGRKIQRGGSSKKHVIVNAWSSNFTEEAVDILGLLAEVKTGYTREVLVNHLLKLTGEIGRVPTQKDVIAASKSRGVASLATYQSHFGSFTEALLAAGLDIHKLVVVQNKSKDELLDDLRFLAQKIGRTPTTVDLAAVKLEGRVTATSVTYVARFGSYMAAVIAAGLKPNRHPSKTDAEMLEELKALAQQIGRIPTQSDITAAYSNGEISSSGTYRLRFGSLDRALERVGLRSRRVENSKKSSEELAVDLVKLSEQLGRIPTQIDVGNASKKEIMASAATYKRRFGTWKSALRAAGLIDDEV